jgi:hypothetical protein
MIPKILHYAWFGEKEIPKEALNCIDSWRRLCPDYELKLWNEKNYDSSKCNYIRDAYSNKKWAFVTDFLRLDVLYEYGGVYLDTDVELIKSLDSLLERKLFVGMEKKDGKLLVNTGSGIGAIAHHPIIKAMKNDYFGIDFVLPAGQLNLTPCSKIQTALLKKYGVRMINEIQEFDNFTVFPTDYFCPLNYDTGEIDITKNTYSIHRYHTTWESELRRDIIECRRVLRKKYKSELLIKIVAQVSVYRKHFGYRFPIEILKGSYAKLLKGWWPY